MVNEKIAAFLEDIKSVDWFARSGIPNEKYYMVYSLYEACDTWGRQYMEVWEPQISTLEDAAEESLDDDTIDETFDIISAAIGDIVWKKFGDFIERQQLGEELAVCFELFDMVKRDVAWACIENLLDMPGFFTMLTEIYREGYFPCSWVGAYPSGRAVVL